MHRRYGRRDITRLLGAASVGAWILPTASTAGAVQTVGASGGASTIPSWPTELRRLAPSVYAYTQASGPGVDNASLSNAGVIEGPDGLLAIDTLGPPIHAKAFKAAAEAATRKRFGRVINTHHHRDHTNGNCFFAPVEIVSSAYTRQATIDDGIPARPYDTRPLWQAGMAELKLAPPTTTLSAGATDTRAYLELITEGARKRYAMGMSPGRAAADIPLGRFAGWTNPERNAWNMVRLYAEFAGTLKPEQDLVAQNAAVSEYHSIRGAR